MLYAFDGKQPIVGKDTYVSETAMVIGDVEIGDNCYIGHGAILRGDYGRIEIGPGSAIEEGVVVHAPPKTVHHIGAHVTVGHGAVLHGLRISDYAVIGMQAVVSIASKVGEWAIVGEGAVVRGGQVVPDNVIVVGNPAEVVRETREKDKERWSKGKQIYVDLAKKYLEEGMIPIT